MAACHLTPCRRHRRCSPGATCAAGLLHLKAPRPNRRPNSNSNSNAQAQEILTDVKDLGEEGFLKHARRLGDIAPDQTSYIIDRAALKAAFDALPKSQQELLHSKP